MNGRGEDFELREISVKITWWCTGKKWNGSYGQTVVWDGRLIAKLGIDIEAVGTQTWKHCQSLRPDPCPMAKYGHDQLFALGLANYRYQRPAVTDCKA